MWQEAKEVRWNYNQESLVMLAVYDNQCGFLKVNQRQKEEVMHTVRDGGQQGLVYPYSKSSHNLPLLRLLQLDYSL
jgi:hypothetical protein